MARVTIKELQEKIIQQQTIIDEQLKDIQKLQEDKEAILKDGNVVSKLEYETLLKEFNNLQINYKTLEEFYDKEKEKNSILINKETEKKHNERGAGRKSTLVDEQLDKIKELKEQGLSYGNIAKEVELSKAYVYKLINKRLK